MEQNRNAGSSLLAFKSAAITLVILAFIGFWWFIEAGNIDYGNTPGMYTYTNRAGRFTLELRANHEFHEIVSINGNTKESVGNWELFPSQSMKHVKFSQEFITLPSQLRNSEGQAYGTLENWFGLMFLKVGPQGSGPTFHKRVF
jgi:hypothetical protein